jgi:Rrf2 family protein
MTVAMAEARDRWPDAARMLGSARPRGASVGNAGVFDRPLVDSPFFCAYIAHIMSSTNSRFRTAVHALAVIAHVDEQQAKSEQIAASVATDASVVRRLLSSLREAGLVQAVEGRAGGYALGRSPARISLLDVYRAIGPDTLFPLPERKPNPDCAVGAHIHQVLDEPLDAAHAALEQRLAATSLAEVMRRIAAAS